MFRYLNVLLARDAIASKNLCSSCITSLKCTVDSKLRNSLDKLSLPKNPYFDPSHASSFWLILGVNFFKWMHLLADANEIYFY